MRRYDRLPGPRQAHSEGRRHVIIPENVPHGWAGIADHVTYLSVRPDQKKVLQTGCVHPAIAATKKAPPR